VLRKLVRAQGKRCSLQEVSLLNQIKTFKKILRLKSAQQALDPSGLGVLERKTNPLATLTIIRHLSQRIIPCLQSIEDSASRQRKAEIYKIQNKLQIMMPRA
jgi:hypothetical protein